jgi:hypothetical protein
MKAGDRIVITGDHPDNGRAYQIKAVKENGWVLTTDNHLFHEEFFELCSPCLTYSPELEGLPSPGTDSEFKQPNLLKTTQTHNSSCDRTTHPSPSIQISETTTPNGESLTSFGIHSPAPEPVTPEKEKDYRIQSQPCGEKVSDASLKVNRNSLLLNNLKELSDGDFERYLEPSLWQDTLTKLSLSRRRNLEPDTADPEFLLFPTPTSCEGVTNRPAGVTRCESWWKSLNIIPSGQQLSAEAFATIQGFPPGWFSPLCLQTPQDALEADISPDEPLLQDKQRSPSVESSISIPAQKPLTLKACEEELEPLGFSLNVKRRGRHKGIKQLYWSSGGKNYHQIFKPETPYEVIRDYALSVLEETPKSSSDESCPSHPTHLTNSPENVMENLSPESLPIAQIRRDGGTQPRAAINHLTITEYAEDMQAGDRFPAVLVFYDGTDYWLADGFHRVLAAESLGMAEIAVEIRQGTRRDAILYSVGANAKHGLRRSNTDKRRVVTTLLEDKEWSKYSNNQIAKLCCVSLDLVNRLRRSLNDSLSERERIYTTKHGTVSTMDTANIGRHRKSLSDTLSQSNDDEVLTEAALSELSLDEPATSEVVTAVPIPMTTVTDTHHAVQIKEGLNYKAGNGGCEWYVRVEQTTWEKLLEYQAHVGTATLDSAIKRLLERVGVRENTGL